MLAFSPQLRQLTHFLLLILTATLAGGVRAQEGTATAFLHEADASAFPEVAVRLSVSDSTGRGIPGLGPEVIHLLEDDNPVTELSVTEMEVGVQVVFVLNATSVFKPRDAKGITRLDYVKQALLLWGGREGAMRPVLDDVTLLTPEGALVQHSSSALEFQQALEAYTPEYAEEGSGFQLLQQALTFAADATPRPGMRRVIVFFSSWIPTVNDLPVTDAASRATELHVPIYTFLAGPLGAESQPGAEHLPRLAELTGATYTFFTSPETILPVYELIASQRAHYVLSYRSALATSGRHELTATVEADGLSAATPATEFALTVEAPAVTFVTPPAELTRRSSNPTLAAALLPPTSQELQVIIEFPDGHPRTITRGQLLVDGALEDEDLSGPFERYTWDLTGYESSGAHRLRVVVQDELGLEGVTIEHPVRVEVVVERSPIKRAEPFLRPLAILAGIVLAGVLLAGAVAVSLRRPRPREVVRERQEPASLPAPPPSPPRKGKAYLEMTTEDGEPRRVVELADDVVTLGRDPAQVQAAFEDRSVSRRHARIVENGNGVYHLYDENSTSGTWLNLEPVTLAGAPLRHGDQINLGRVQLIFHLRSLELQDTPLPRPVSIADTRPMRLRPEPAPDVGATDRSPPLQ